MREESPKISYCDVNDLVCPVCQTFFRDAVTLPCGHSCCRECLRTRMEDADKGKNCPACSKPVEKNIDELPTALALNSLASKARARFAEYSPAGSPTPSRPTAAEAAERPHVESHSFSLRRSTCIGPNNEMTDWSSVTRDGETVERLVQRDREGHTTTTMNPVGATGTAGAIEGGGGGDTEQQSTALARTQDEFRELEQRHDEMMNRMGTHMAPFSSFASSDPFRGRFFQDFHNRMDRVFGQRPSTERTESELRDAFEDMHRHMDNAFREFFTW